jgi:hypothetical protein
MPTAAVIVLMDVDGVLHPSLRTDSDGTVKASVSPEHAQALALAAEKASLVWATTYAAETTDAIAAQAGVRDAGRLPLRGKRTAAEKLKAVRRWAERATADPSDAPTGIVMVDDSLTEEDALWAATQPVPFLLIRPHPAYGLTVANAEAIGEWVSSVDKKERSH